jgi:hypothetical protein
MALFKEMRRLQGEMERIFKAAEDSFGVHSPWSRVPYVQKPIAAKASDALHQNVQPFGLFQPSLDVNEEKGLDTSPQRLTRR